MPRLARIIAASGFYHVILKGNGGRILFENDADKHFFFSLIEKYGTKYEIEYHAWCLLDNHVHMLIRDPSNQRAKALHDINSVYANHYNKKIRSLRKCVPKPF